MAINLHVRDQEAVKLVNARAAAEGRSARNAATRTLIEALKPIYGQNQSVQDRPDNQNPQAKKRRNFLEGAIEK